MTGITGHSFARESPRSRITVRPVIDEGHARYVRIIPLGEVKQMKSIALVLLSLAVLYQSQLSAQAPCVRPSSLMIEMVGAKTPGPDGLIHLSYDFGYTDPKTNDPYHDKSPPPLLVTEMQNAVDEWNSYSGVTGVLLERSTSGFVDISINRNDDPS